MNVVDIKGVRIGEGIPKTITSLMAPDCAGQISEALLAVKSGLDCLELRADYCTDVHDPYVMTSLCRSVLEVVPSNPLLFTFRSESQGGQLSLSVDEYVALNRSVIEAHAADMIDIEIGIGERLVRSLCELSWSNGMIPVVSHHDFERTPETREIISLLREMEQMGAGICKIATMANAPRDVLNLLCATEERVRESHAPLLTMAMGSQGSITRLTGELFGSCMSFCSLGLASAPGQVPCSQARRLMKELHDLAF